MRAALPSSTSLGQSREKSASVNVLTPKGRLLRSQAHLASSASSSSNVPENVLPFKRRSRILLHSPMCRSACPALQGAPLGVTSHLVPDIPAAPATCCQSGLKAAARILDP